MPDAAGPGAAAAALPPAQASALLSAFAAFLTVALHSLLYHRRLYPPASFLLARAYNLPVRQSRHPAVCAWVRDAVAAVAAQLRAAAARRVAIAVHAPAAARRVVERWVFDLRGFPADPGLVRVAPADAADPDPDARPLNWTDVHEALRAALRRLAHVAEALPPPPDGSTFTLAIELADGAPAPIRHPQLWIPSEPHLQPPTPFNPHHGHALGGSSTTPVRLVHAGPLFFDCWVEQGKPEPERDVPASSAAHDSGSTP